MQVAGECTQRRSRHPHGASHGQPFFSADKNKNRQAGGAEGKAEREHTINENMINIAKGSNTLQQLHDKRYFQSIERAKTCVLAGVCFGEGRTIVVYETRKMNGNNINPGLVVNNGRLLTLLTSLTENLQTATITD
jgi:hypothetical protein